LKKQAPFLVICLLKSSNDEHSVGEIREFIVGYSEMNRLLVVCFTEREDEKVRIITARKPTKIEREDYEENE
jgi:uncharacterized protein